MTKIYDLSDKLEEKQSTLSNEDILRFLRVIKHLRSLSLTETGTITFNEDTLTFELRNYIDYEETSVQSGSCLNLLSTMKLPTNQPQIREQDLLNFKDVVEKITLEGDDNPLEYE